MTFVSLLDESSSEGGHLCRGFSDKALMKNIWFRLILALPVAKRSQLISSPTLSCLNKGDIYQQQLSFCCHTKLNM